MFLKWKFGFLYCKFKPTNNGLSALSYILQTFYKYCKGPARSPQTTRLKPQVYTNLCWIDAILGWMEVNV